MDGHNRFETRTTFTLARLEWFAALLVSIVLAVLHFGEIRWPVFVGFFVVIDVVGYLPGAVAFRRSPTHQIGCGYYIAYNTMHSLLTGAAMVGLWALTVGPEWALLAVPIHLFGDRGLFGNTLKPFRVPFEPATHPAFAAFLEAYESAPAPSRLGGSAAPALVPARRPLGERAREERTAGVVGQ